MEQIYKSFWYVTLNLKISSSIHVVYQLPWLLWIDIQNYLLFQEKVENVNFLCCKLA